MSECIKFSLWFISFLTLTVPTQEDFRIFDFNEAQALASQLLKIQETKQDNPHSNTGTIIGIVVGVILLLTLLIGVVSFILCRRSK